ncbi:DeoR/GlpR family DNA-binding transcription regulator [Scopulibacillus cellulosilyticus]|uniref:DeoR/GlpR family DNA-binding transcription regulator n=1 Tax=Scopulibacillus cellulosilyticus TaxID=2665665 RepID=A0ABW2Q3D7_9BACL
MLPGERKQKITDLIRTEKKVYVSKLSQEFNVTEETIRRDLEKLEKEGIAVRTYGGAILNRSTDEDLPYITRKTLNIELKRKIAAKVEPLINDGDCVMIGPGSTDFEAAAHLYNKQNLTLISNSIRVLNELADTQHHIISTGGNLRGRSHSLVGPAAEATVKRYNADKYLFSCKGLDLEKGITESNEPEAELKKAMLESSKMNILLVDHTKFNSVSFINLCNFDQISVLVTDKMPPEEWKEKLSKHNIELIY